MSHFWNIVWTINTLLLCQVTNVSFIKWNVLKMWLSKYEMFPKRDFQNLRYFRNATFKIWSVSQTWCTKHDVQKMKICQRNVTFETWTVSKMSRSWNIVWTINTFLLCRVRFHVLNVTFSETFHLLNFTFHCLNTWRPFVVPCHKSKTNFCSIDLI